ncbi:hypothetical protein [Sphingobacterium sp. E70]|uniref:hypothetical protein n=1 Tax=Sphingobacterium sp. E70 TaxID=2853439 RepID=UPI002795237B|nr:hypothetical protein [Sphingobacterium sp. E70]
MRKSLNWGIPKTATCWCGERCYIENAILDKNCRIGNDVRIKGGPHLEDGDFQTHAICDGIVVVKKNAVISNGVSIGC